MENESKRLLELPGPISVKTETSADFPQASADFRTVPNPTEEFGKVPQVAEGRENHTLTVRETARMFEAAGVARTERSIVNWCQPNRQEISRLDSYFDPNERKYFITPESVELAVAEEKAKAAKTNEPSEPVGTVPKDSEWPVEDPKNDPTLIKELELQVRDLEITNRVKDEIIGMKDQFIERLQQEQHAYIERLINSSHRVGQLETKLLQIEAPK